MVGLRNNKVPKTVEFIEEKQRDTEKHDYIIVFISSNS